MLRHEFHATPKLEGRADDANGARGIDSGASPA
jgi:hypothetical protein